MCILWRMIPDRYAVFARTANRFAQNEGLDFGRMEEPCRA
jgi:hypothetical protein